MDRALIITVKDVAVAVKRQKSVAVKRLHARRARAEVNAQRGDVIQSCTFPAVMIAPCPGTDAIVPEIGRCESRRLQTYCSSRETCHTTVIRVCVVAFPLVLQQ